MVVDGRWMTKRLWTTMMALGLWVAGAPASATELLLAQPSACAIGDELWSRSEQTLGRPLTSVADLRCTVHIVHDQGWFAARLELERRGRPSQMRSFRAPSCERLTETLTLAVVLSIGASSSASAEPLDARLGRVARERRSERRAASPARRGGAGHCRGGCP
jgi:hypothetical protein